MYDKVVAEGEVAESCLPAGRGRNMFYVYILKSDKDSSLYIGKTNNVRRRLSEHNSGHTSATKSKRPYLLLETIECSSLANAIEMEKEYKKGYKREEIRRNYGLV